MNAKILDTLKKLLRLSTNNENQHEAEAAMLKAQEIAIQNNINIAQISLDEDKKEVKEYKKESKHAGQRFSICHKFVSNILIKYFNVGIVTTGDRDNGRYVNFIGTADNVEFAKFAYDYLTDTFMNCWRNYKLIYEKPLNYRETYFFGLYKGFSDKLKANKEK